MALAVQQSASRNAPHLSVVICVQMKDEEKEKKNVEFGFWLFILLYRSFGGGWAGHAISAMIKVMQNDSIKNLQTLIESFECLTRRMAAYLLSLLVWCCWKGHHDIL